MQNLVKNIAKLVRRFGYGIQISSKEIMQIGQTEISYRNALLLKVLH